MRVAGVLFALVVVSLVAGATIALLTLDLGALSQPLTRWASVQLGRALVIDGHVSIRAGRTLRLSAEGVRLANTSWGSRGDMLLLHRLTVEVDALSLIRRPVIVKSVEIDGFDLLLERRADGANNWEFGADSDDDSAWPESLPVVVDRVSLPGARLRFIGPRLDRPLDLRFDRLEQQRVAGGMLELAGRGTANDEGLSLDATAGPFAQLVAGRDFRLGIDGRLGELAVTAHLRVDDIARPVNTELDVKVRGPGADYLTTRFGVRKLGSGPLILDGVVRPAADGAGIEGELTGEIGQFILKARGVLADPTEMRKLHAQLEIVGPDLSFAGGLAGVDRLPAEPFRLTADVERAGDAVRIHDATLTMADGRADISGTIKQFTALAGNDLRFRLEGSDAARFRDLLRLPAAVTGAFDISGGLKTSGPEGGAAEIIDVQATTTLGKAEISGPLGASPDYYETRLRFAASGPSLERIGVLTGAKGLPDVDFAGTGEVEWTAGGAVIRNGELRAGRDQLALDGRIARDPLGPGTDFTWQLRGPDLREFAVPLRVDGLPAGPFELRGRLRREPRVSRLDDVQGTVAGTDVRFSGRIADQPRLGTTLDLSVEGPRLEAFADLLPDYKLPAGQFRVAGDVALTPKRLALRGLKFAAAGAEGTVDADIELPLSAVRGEFLVTAKGRDVTRFLPRLGSAQTAAESFDLRVRGQAQDGAWRLDEAEFDTAAASITGHGKLDWAPDFSATALKLTVKAPDLAAAGRLFALKLPAQPFDLTAEFTGTASAFKVEQAIGRFGTSDFDGRMQLEWGERPVLDLDFRSDVLDLRSFLGAPTPAADSAPAAPAGPARRRSNLRLIPDAEIPLGWLTLIDGSLAVRTTRALVAGVALDDVRVAARLTNGNLTLDALELKAPPDGRLTLSGSVAPHGRGAAVRLAGGGTRVRLAWLDEMPAVRDARPRVEFAMDFAGEGATWRELAQSLDGRLSVTSGAGALPVTTMNRLFGNLWSDLAATVIPAVGASDTTNVRCLAAFLNTTDGVVQTAPALVMQTDKVNVISHGSVDLRTEQINFYLNTAPRRGRVDVSVAEIVNPYMKVTGFLASPGLAVDPKGALFSGGAAVATAGISILARGAWDRLFKAEDPCAAASAEATRLEAGAPAPRKWRIPWPRRGR